MLDMCFGIDTNTVLIGVTTHGRKGLSHFINQGINEDIANHFEIPVITFKMSGHNSPKGQINSRG